MTAVAITEQSIVRVKRVLQDLFPEAKSSALTESLARGLGYSTNAALRAAFRDDSDVQLLDVADFADRLGELSGRPVSVHAGRLHMAHSALHGDGVFPTAPASGTKRAAPTSRKATVWRSVMIAGINEAIRRRLLTIRPGDNRWPSSDDRGAGFDFSIGGEPAYGHLHDAGFDEVRIKVLVWPAPDVAEWAPAAAFHRDHAYRQGDLYASGWLERRDGAWLQTASSPTFFCRRSRMETAGGFTIGRPLGFAPSGPFKM